MVSTSSEVKPLIKYYLELFYYSIVYGLYQNLYFLIYPFISSHFEVFQVKEECFWF